MEYPLEYVLLPVPTVLGLDVPPLGTDAPDTTPDSWGERVSKVSPNETRLDRDPPVTQPVTFMSSLISPVPWTEVLRSPYLPSLS